MMALALILGLIGPARAARAPAPAALPLVLERLEERDRKTTSLSAHFSQIVRSPYSKDPQAVEGTIEFMKPNLLRIEHEKPERQTVVCDGTWLWFWRPATKQAIQTRYEDWKKSEPLTQAILDFGRYADLAKKYETSLGERELELILKPRGDKNAFELSLLLDSEDFFPREARLTAGDVSVETRFQRVIFNPEIKDKETRFKFSPPKNAEIFRNFKTP
ncbi:MAG: outer membrane lipoprotein carrier protein LolA [Elusimicrobia bacterium]|nr:outer membrane lipoprotein carrier protein LolA [Elusimicrobiota bacterium]